MNASYLFDIVDVTTPPVNIPWPAEAVVGPE